MLKDFFLNEALRNEVKTYLIDFLKTQAIEKTFNHQPTEHIAEAKECIDGAFEHLEVLFASKPEVKEQINPSR